MAIQLPNFLGVPVQKPDYSGLGDAISNYYSGKMMPKDDLIKAVQAQFAKPQAEADLKYANLRNIYQALQNQFYPQDIQSQIKERESLAQNRSLGLGGRGGVRVQQQALLMNDIKRDNPNFSDTQAFEAAGNLLDGKTVMSDGTPFNASGLTRQAAAGAVLQGTTAALATQGVQASQAEAEIPVVDKYIQEGRSPYGDTIMGYSGQQTKDMLNTSDDAAQERLGKYGASELLSLEKAGLGLKMAGIQSGQVIMDEAMQKANQQIKALKYLQTDKARQVALDTYRQALTDMLKQRKSVGVLQSSLLGGNGVPTGTSIPINNSGLMTNNPAYRSAKQMSDDEIRAELGV